MANAILRRTGNEGLAIRTANARVGEHRDTGGIVDPTQSGIGGIQPTAQTAANPLMQGMIQRYSSLPPEKLQELAGMLGNSPQGQIVNRLLQQKRMMPNATPAPQQQQTQTPPTGLPGATAPVQQPLTGPTVQQNRGGMTPHRDMGGPLGIPMSAADPSWTRQEEEASTRTPSGFLAGSTPGRADAVHTQAPAGSYVIPADTIAGLGEGNSLAGAHVMDMIIRSGPHGIPMPQGTRGRGPPPAPRPAGTGYQAKGGGVHGKGHGGPTPVALSHGEFVLTPEEVMAIGDGDLARGHKILDAWVVLERKRQLKKMAALPGPVGARKTKKVA
jgi:hypothetical protein